MAQAQKRGGKAAFIDAEHAMDPDYAKKLGVNVNELLISQPDSGEEALNILESLVRSGMISVVVVDSVAALTPLAELEGEMGEQHVGRQARMMGQALRKLTAIAASSHTLIIFINQIRMKIGIMFGNPETTPGGRALPFAASVRIDIRRIAQVKKGEHVVGNRVKAKVVKNKVAAPFRFAEFDIMFNEGISYESDVLNAAVNHGVVKKSGSSLSFEGERLGVGFDNSRLKLKKKTKNRLRRSKKDDGGYSKEDQSPYNRFIAAAKPFGEVLIIRSVLYQPYRNVAGGFACRERQRPHCGVRYAELLLRKAVRGSAHVRQKN